MIKIIYNTLGYALLHESRSAALCPDPVDIDYGMVTFTGKSIGDTATYTCDPGFELIGGATTTCTLLNTSSAVFQPAPPFCRREFTAKCHMCFMIHYIHKYL